MKFFEDSKYYSLKKSTYINLRWIGIIGQLISVYLVHFYFDIDEWELYDRLNDPNEMKNVYNDPQYKEIVESLTNELYELRKKYKDSDELSKTFIYE